jgi:hypothetical protein
VSGGAVTDTPTLGDLADLADRAAAAVAGELCQRSTKVEALLAAGGALISEWTPRTVIDGMVFVLDRGTGTAHHRDGSTTWTATWRPEDPDSLLQLQSDGGIGGYLAELLTAPERAFVYHLSSDARRRLVEAQPEVDRWLERDTSSTATMLAAYLADKELWLELARVDVGRAVLKPFADSHRPCSGPSPVMTAPVCRYLAAAYRHFGPAQRDAFTVLLGDGWALLQAIATARGL